MNNLVEMKPKVSTSVAEQETIINYNPAEGKIASVYTCVPKDLRRMWKLYNEHPEEVSVFKDDKYATEFIVPSDWIKVRPKRKVSEEQRAAAAERLAAYRASVGEDDDDEDDDEEEDADTEEE